jgi:hypothetical protein
MDDRIRQLAEFDINTAIRLSDPYYPYDIAASKLGLLKSSAEDATKNPGFWDELPEATKSNITAWVDGLLTTLSQIAQYRDDGTWLSQNYAATQNQIISYYDSLYTPFVIGIREYINAEGMTKQELNATMRRIRNAVKEAEDKAKVINDLTRQSADLTANASTERLSEFFLQQVEGFPRPVNDKKGLKKFLMWIKIQLLVTIRGERGYISSSRSWFVGVLLSIGFTTYAASRALHGIDLSRITLEEVLARALLIAAPAYAIRFCVKNFNANKHQVTINRHRAVVLDTLLSFLSRPEVSDSVREQLIAEAAKQVFEPGESGYLNRRDTVGSNDSIIELPSNIKA